MTKQPILSMDQNQASVNSLVLAFLQWTDKTIEHIRRGRLLPLAEKKQAIGRLEKYRKDLDWYVDLYSETFSHYEPAAASIERTVRYFHSMQAILNAEMAYYEVEPYPLPESVRSDDPKPFYREQTYIARGGAMAPTMPKGATIHGTLIDPANWPATTGVITVIYRTNRRSVRRNVFGRVGLISDNRLVLIYDNPQRADNRVSIPLEWVKFIYQITAITIQIK